MDDNEIKQLFQSSLFADLQDDLKAKRPFLAHYTTIQVLEKILETNEVWFSNPLFMNDIEEVRFGVLQGHELVMTRQEVLDACKTKERAQLFKYYFGYYFDKFANEHSFDTYVFCLSNHNRLDDDGMLSMWRGYGANGNGVAIVFETAKMNLVENSPLITGPVNYATTEARQDWLKALLTKFEKILSSSDIPDDKLYHPAYWLFERIKLFALFTKHQGFKEEDEWRVVYFPDRDIEKKLEPMFHYWIGPRGVEPKLRLKVVPIKGVTYDDISLAKITERIILGPSISSPMAHASVTRMLEVLGHPELKQKLRVSRIPFRAIR